MTAPFGRRLCEVAENRTSGGYRIFSLLDREGPAPEPGQFYMLAGERELGRGRRAALSCPRLLGRRDGAGARTGFASTSSSRAVGPGTDRLCELERGEEVWVTGPLGRAFSSPQQLAPAAAGAILVGGGIGIAPLAIWRRRCADGHPDPRPARLPQSRALGRADELFCLALCPRCASPARTATPATRATSPTCSRRCWRATMRARPPSTPAARRRCSRRSGRSAASGGRLRAGDGVADGLRLRRLLRLRRPARRAAATCASASTARWCGAEETSRRRWSAGSGPAEDDRLRRRVLRNRARAPGDQRLGHLRRDRRPARPSATSCSRPSPSPPSSRRRSLRSRGPGNPRRGSGRRPAGMINSIGLPNKGLEGFLAEDLPPLASCRCR